MVMEFVDGVDLRVLLYDYEKMPPDQFTMELKMRYAYDISNAILYIHTQNPPIIHQGKNK